MKVMCFVNATSLSKIHRKACGFSWEQKGVIGFDCFELFQLFAFLFFACKTWIWTSLWTFKVKFRGFRPFYRIVYGFVDRTSLLMNKMNCFLSSGSVKSSTGWLCGRFPTVDLALNARGLLLCQISLIVQHRW